MDKGDDPYEILGIPYDATELDATTTKNVS